MLNYFANLVPGPSLRRFSKNPGRFTLGRFRMKRKCSLRQLLIFESVVQCAVWQKSMLITQVHLNCEEMEKTRLCPFSSRFKSRKKTNAYDALRWSVACDQQKHKKNDHVIKCRVQDCLKELQIQRKSILIAFLVSENSKCV